jgi:trehalose 6-phosphate phosphatase
LSKYKLELIVSNSTSQCMSLSNQEFNPLADALFLDFDGTLVELAGQPDGVVMPPQLIDLLAQLQQALGGAIAVVSGRPVQQLDHYLAPLHLSLAGVHGLERRDSQGQLTELPAPDAARLMERLVSLVARHPGLLLEPKRGALALHYRQVPQLEQACVEAMHHAISRVPGFTLLRGKMVVEAKAALADKGDAIAAFMAAAPFAGRRPWFIGDDVTDEAGFARVQNVGGIGIKIGDGDSQAQARLANPQALQAWLAQALRVPQQRH